MKAAIDLALLGFAEGEVPIGAVVVHDGQIIGRGYNRKEKSVDATQHAEIIAIKQASAHLGNWRLMECSLFVTLEPCLMCSGAIQQSRVKNVYFGAFDTRGGSLLSRRNIQSDPNLNHSFSVVGGFLEEECSEILKRFFRIKRKKN